MNDQYATNHLGIRALTLGIRKVRRCSVSIDGVRYGGVVLAPYNGEKVMLSCVDVYGLEYAVETIDGNRIGRIKYIRQ